MRIIFAMSPNITRQTQQDFSKTPLVPTTIQVKLPFGDPSYFFSPRGSHRSSVLFAESSQFDRCMLSVNRGASLARCRLFEAVSTYITFPEQILFLAGKVPRF